MPRRSIAEVKVLDVQKRRIPNKHYVSGRTGRTKAGRCRPRSRAELREGRTEEEEEEEKRGRQRCRGCLSGLSRRGPTVPRASLGMLRRCPQPGDARGMRAGDAHPGQRPRARR